MARAGTNGLGAITNLEKMAAFFKSFEWCPVLVKKESHTKNGRKKSLKELSHGILSYFEHRQNYC